MAKDIALTPESKVVGTLWLLWGADYLSARYLNYPFLYCWLSPVTIPLYIAWGHVLLYLVLAYSVYLLVKGRIVHSFCGVMIFIGIIELPRFADMAFRLGGSCG